MNRRNGMGLVEVLIGMLLLVTVLMLVWSFVVPDRKRFEVDQNRFTALQGVVLLDEYLSEDLQQIVVKPLDAADPSRVYTLGKPLKIGLSPPSLSFLVASEPTPGTGLLSAHVVTYVRDATTGHIVRQEQWPDRLERKEFFGVTAKEIQFSQVTIRPKTLPGVSWSSDPYIYLVKYQLCGISDALTQAPDPDGHSREQVTMVRSVPIPARATRLDNPYWISTHAEGVKSP